MNFALLFSLLVSLTQAQTIDVKVDQAQSGHEDTTILIKKGSTGSTNKKVYTMTEGHEDIVGENDVLRKNAEKNWKKACAEFKMEFKEINKDNKIVYLSCGTMTCFKDGVESICQSKATHKVRVLIEE